MNGELLSVKKKSRVLTLVSGYLLTLSPGSNAYEKK